MAYIVLSIIGLAAVIVVKSDWNRKKQITFFLSVLIGGLIVYITIDLMDKPNVIEKGPASWMAEISWFEIGLYFVMLAGMAAKYFYDAIGEGNQIRLQKWQFIKPIFISPIVFGIVYGSIGKETSVLLLLIFSFQNGFFWQTVLCKTLMSTETELISTR